MTTSLSITSTPAGPGVDLAGKRMLVTGASRGVGAEVATIAASCGADVGVNYRSKARRAEAVADRIREAGRSAVLLEADLTDVSAVERMFQQAVRELGGLDAVVLNASGGLEKGMAEDYAMVLNRDSQVNAARLAMKSLSDGSVVVFVTSHLAHFHGEKTVPDVYEAVAASKKAGEDALRALMPELEERGIRLIVVSGDLIDGTITPKLLDRMKPGMISARREEAGWLPTTTDFATAIVMACGDTELESGATVYVGSTDWSEM